MVGRLCHMGRKDVGRRADELLEQFGLTDAANRSLKTYSGGMRRRLDLAAALVARPPVLFLDEPTTGLDPQSRQDLWGVIEELVGRRHHRAADHPVPRGGRPAGRRHRGGRPRRVIAEGTPAELKADLGTTVIGCHLGRPRRRPSGRRPCWPRRRQPDAGASTAPTVELTVEDGPTVAAEALRSLDPAGITVARPRAARAQPRRRLPAA